MQVCSRTAHYIKYFTAYVIRPMVAEHWSLYHLGDQERERTGKHLMRITVENKEEDATSSSHHRVENYQLLLEPFKCYAPHSTTQAGNLFQRGHYLLL
eukprot:997711-Amphidinium_carterae.1